MSSPIQLIVGLANPGKEYADTRHNAGAWFVEELAHQAQITLRPTAKYHGLHGVGELHYQSFHLLIPTTFMNHSGQAVQALVNYHKLTPQAILVAHDDVDLPVGTVKLKVDGGDGGHNGLKDIIRHLHTKKFYRLRIGVGRPMHSKATVDYVLHPPTKTERSEIDTALQRVEETLPLILSGKLQQAMQKLHTEPEL